MTSPRVPATTQHLFFFSLRMLLQQCGQFLDIGSHDFIHFLAALVEFERGHRLDTLGSRHVFGFIDIDFCKYDRSKFRRQAFELGCYEFARATCVYGE